MAEILVVEQGKDSAGIQTGGERTLVTQQANPPAAPATAPAATPDLTEEELVKVRREVDIAMGWAVPEPKVEPAATAAAPVPAPAPTPEAAAPAAAPAPEPVAPAPQPTTEQLIKQAADEAATATAERLHRTEAASPAPAPEPEVVEMELTEEDRRDIEIAGKMEELNPKLKGKAEEVKKFALARYDYEKKWLEANPGSAFDPDAADHEEFYKGQPHIDEALYRKAEIRLEAARLVAEEMGEVKQELQQQKDQKLMETARPFIHEAVNKRVHNVVEKTDPALAALLMVDGKVKLDKAQVDKIVDADPIAAEVLEPLLVGELLPIMAELEKTTIKGLNYKLDPENNQIHARIGQYLYDAEKVAAQDPKTSTRDGRTLVSHGDRSTAVEKIFKSKASQEDKHSQVSAYDAKHFTLSVDDLQEYVVDQISTRAKKEIERLDKMAQKKYKKGDPVPTPKPTQAAPSPQPTAAPANNGHPKPPSISAQDTTVDTTRPAGSDTKNFGQQAVETHWRK